MSKKTPPTIATILSPSFFRALCDPTRLAILTWLARQRSPRSVTEIAASGVGVDLSVVSRHLAVLRDAGLLAADRQGKSVLYRVDAATAASALRRLADALEACCPPNPRKPEKTP